MATHKCVATPGLRNTALDHGLSRSIFKSKVVAKDDTTLVVCDFIYDGKGPDAFFIVGSKNDPNPKDAKPGKSPFNRKKDLIAQFFLCWIQK